MILAFELLDIQTETVLKKFKIINLILIVIALSSLARAAYTENTDVQNPQLRNDTQNNRQEIESSTGSIESSTRNKKPSSGTKKSLNQSTFKTRQEFVPSEKIKADSSIPFPVDI